jgi:hypothetical protein
MTECNDGRNATRLTFPKDGVGHLQCHQDSDAENGPKQNQEHVRGDVEVRKAQKANKCENTGLRDPRQGPDAQRPVSERAAVHFGACGHGGCTGSGVEADVDGGEDREDQDWLSRYGVSRLVSWGQHERRDWEDDG